MERPVGDAGVAAHGGEEAGRAVAGEADGVEFGGGHAEPLGKSVISVSFLVTSLTALYTSAASHAVHLTAKSLEPLSRLCIAAKPGPLFRCTYLALSF